MELRCVYESEGAKNNEAAADLDHKESEVEASGAAIGYGRKNGGSKENGNSVLNSVSKIVSQIKKPPHRRSGSPVNWFPRKKTDSYLKRKIRLLQENKGTLDEALGNANPHYTRIAREKIAAREAARKAMEARKAAMVEASWCRILRAARIQCKGAEAELEKAEKCAAEAFEAARAKGVMVYDRPDSPRRPCEIESYSSIGGRSTHTVTASFETAFEVDKEVMATIKKAFLQLASCPPSSNKDDFKDLLWKISQNPDDNETDPELAEISSEFEFDNGDDNAANVQGIEKKQKNFNCRQFPSDCNKNTNNSSTELANVMLDRLKGLQEDELASLATIVATCGLNAALLNLEHSKYEQGTAGSRRRNSSATRFMDGYLNTKEPVTEVPSLDKFLVKHVSRLEREVQEARNSRCRQTPGASEVLNADSTKHTLSEPVSDLGSILVKHVSKLEKEIQEARKSNKTNSLIGSGKTAALSGPIQHEEDCKELRNSRGPSVNMQKTGMEVQRTTVSSYQDKENIDCNTPMPSTVTPGKRQARELGEITNGTLCSSEVSAERGQMKISPVKHVTRLERAKLEVLNSFSSQEQSSLDKILVKPVHRLEREKLQALERGSEYSMQRDHQKHGTNVTVSESLDKILVKRVSRLEKERMAFEAEYGPTSTVRKKDQQPEKMESSLDEILVKHQSKLEKAKLASSSRQPAYDMIKPRNHGTEVTGSSDSLDKILVRHQSELEKAKLAASQQPAAYDTIKLRKHGTEITAGSDGLAKILVRHQPELEKAQQSEGYIIKHADARKEAREKELQEAWGGLSLGNSIRPRLSRLERERAAWKRAEDEERMLLLASGEAAARKIV